MAIPNLKVILDNSKKLANSIHQLASQRVLVGIPASKAPRKEGKINNAALGYIHDHGAPEVGIPPRPFLGVTVKRKQKEIVERQKKIGKDVLAGKDIQKGLISLGLFVQREVRATINAGVPPTLKSSTLRRRKAQGFKGEKPLIRTAQLRNAINFVIRKK